jgi:hypothetical protein
MLYKKEFFGTLGIGLALMGGYIGYNAWAKSSADAKLAADKAKIEAVVGDTTKPPTRQSIEQVRSMVDSGEISRDAMRGMMEQRMTEVVDGYFAIPEGPERVKYLDEQIDRMQQMRNMFRGSTTRPARDGNRPTTGPTDQQRGEWRDRMQSRMDSRPPAQRAKMSEFFAAMRQRADARGIQMGGPGGMGGGRGPGGGGGQGNGGQGR